MKEHQKAKNLEWSASQEITLSVNLIPAAKQMLQFLAAIDRNRDLYTGPALDRAIYRYQNCWLPLLAKQAEFDVPLVVPLDCEWVWHCHRLNPTRYKTDCEERCGKILDNLNVMSTLQATNCPKETEEIWTRMFPDQPFQLDLKNSLSLKSEEADKAYSKNNSQDYDLVSAVKRQSTFFYQVSRPFISNDTFLKEAVARYKGFLHLIKKNKEKSVNTFCVPTYDIDLIWHTHQVHPSLYCQDTTALFGGVLQHDDDVDSDRSEGKVLDVGFQETTKQWEEVFGLRYWRAGAMFRGNAPNVPFKVEPCLSKEPLDNVSEEVGNILAQFPKKMLVEEQDYPRKGKVKVIEQCLHKIQVLLEIVDVKGVPKEHSDDLFVLIGNQDKDVHHSTKKKLSISSEYGNMQVANFQCEPTEDLIFGLILSNSKTTIGSTSISMKTIVNAERGLSTDTWLELSPSSEITILNPILLRISASHSPPFMAPFAVNLVTTQGVVGSHTSVQDEAGNQVVGLDMREEGSEKKTLFGVIGNGEKRILAKNGGKGWSSMDYSWDLSTQNELNNQGHVYELIMGQRKVIMIPGMKLEYEIKYNKLEEDHDFISAIEFSPQHPYGNALALFNLRSGFLQIKQEWFLTPGIISAFIIRDTLINNGSLMPTEPTKSNTIGTFIGYISETNITKSGSCSGGGGGGCGGKCGGGRCGGSCHIGSNCKARCSGTCTTVHSGGNVGADCRARCSGTCKTALSGGNVGADCRARCSGTCKTALSGGNVGADCRARCSGTCKTALSGGNVGADCRARCSGTCKTALSGSNVGADCRARCGGTCKTSAP